MTWLVVIVLVLAAICALVLALEIWLMGQQSRQAVVEFREIGAEILTALKAVKGPGAIRVLPTPGSGGRSRTTFDVDRERMDEARRASEKIS